jgi:hypothetical protein
VERTPNGCVCEIQGHDDCAKTYHC